MNNKSDIIKSLANKIVSEGIELGDHIQDMPGWYIVSLDNDVASMPFESKVQALAQSKFYEWYNPNLFDISYGIVDYDGNFIDIDPNEMDECGIMEDSSDIPKIGDNVRTRKTEMEGKVEKLGKNNEVFFRVGDGRLMKTSLSNIIVVEKLIDDDENMDRVRPTDKNSENFNNTMSNITDPSLLADIEFADGHYPGSHNGLEALLKLYSRGLMHTEDNDKKHDEEIAGLQNDTNVLKTYAERHPQLELNDRKHDDELADLRQKVDALMTNAAEKSAKLDVEEDQLNELNRSTVISYVPKRIDSAKALARTDYKKAKRITRKDLPRALSKLRDKTYGYAKPRTVEEGLDEARSHSELNKKYDSGREELMSWYYAASGPHSKHDQAWGLSMTDLPKLGINPQAGMTEEAPKGIYFYPMKYAANVIYNGKPFPFGNNMSYIQVFEYSNSHQMTHQTRIDLEQLKQAISQYCSDNIIQQVEYENDPYWFIYNCLTKLGGSEETTIIRWNKILRDLGFTSVIDNGKGWIAYGEPHQVVVLDPRIIKQVKTFSNYQRHVGQQDMKEDTAQLNEFAPNNNNDGGGKWYNDEDLAAILGEGWWDLPIDGYAEAVGWDQATPAMVEIANDWLEEHGYTSVIEACRGSDDEETMDWFLTSPIYKNGLEEGEDMNNTIDTVTVDIPLLIRIMEYAKEDAKTDLDLHNVAEKLIELSKEGRTLTMDDYDSMIGEVSESKMKIGRLGQPEFDSNPDERHGVYVNGRLWKTYWSKEEADRVAESLQRREPDRDINVKPIISEGGMGGLNRCAPSNDVSYQDILNDVTDKWRGDTVKVSEGKPSAVTNDVAKSYMKGAMRDTLSGKKDRNPGIKRAISRLSGTNKPLLDPVKDKDKTATLEGKLAFFLKQVS